MIEDEKLPKRTRKKGQGKFVRGPNTVSGKRRASTKDFPSVKPVLETMDWVKKLPTDCTYHDFYEAYPWKKGPHFHDMHRLYILPDEILRTMKLRDFTNEVRRESIHRLERKFAQDPARKKPPAPSTYNNVLNELDSVLTQAKISGFVTDALTALGVRVPLHPSKDQPEESVLGMFEAAPRLSVTQKTPRSGRTNGEREEMRTKIVPGARIRFERTQRIRTVEALLSDPTGTEIVVAFKGGGRPLSLRKTLLPSRAYTVL